MISSPRIFSFSTYCSIRVMFLSRGMKPEWSLYANTDFQRLKHKIRITPMISSPRIFSFSTYFVHQSDVSEHGNEAWMISLCKYWHSASETEDSPISHDLRSKNLQFLNILVHLSDVSEQGHEAWMISLCKYRFSTSETQDSPISHDHRCKTLQFLNILVH